MKPDLLALLPRPQREAVESAGYRLMRWAAARAVLQARVGKGRVAGPAGEFLTYWMAQSPPPPEAQGELWLSFSHARDQAQLALAGGSVPLAHSPLERALLHLPLLRSFWRQELRLQHFAALRELVPQAWLLDPAPVPPGAVIHGLGSPSWEDVQPAAGQKWQIHNAQGSPRASLPAALTGRDAILIPQPVSNVILLARYERESTGRIVLRMIEAASP
ncbi:hypothetical protein [Prosthecobacter sp.]|uniref:hypothetical protein n=1 Tax=Prosthecobacter sp. TaxID=1965333 RepID=UPI003783CA06